MREVMKTHERTSPTSAEKLPDFCREVWQLLTRSFTNRRVADFRACSPLGKMDASVWAERRVLRGERTSGVTDSLENFFNFSCIRPNFRFYISIIHFIIVSLRVNSMHAKTAATGIEKNEDFQDARHIHHQAVPASFCRHVLHLPLHLCHAVPVDVDEQSHRQRSDHRPPGEILLVQQSDAYPQIHATGRLAGKPYLVRQFGRTF